MEVNIRSTTVVLLHVQKIVTILDNASFVAISLGMTDLFKLRKYVYDQ